MAKKKYYAIVRGRRPGIYRQWYGGDGAHAQVEGFPGARFKGFATRADAEAFIAGFDAGQAPARPRAKPVKTEPDPPPEVPAVGPERRTVVYTDGGCIHNPGPGGWGVVMIRDGAREELSGGYRMTTNNRMELTAAIVGLKAAGPAAAVTLFTDSKYVVNGIVKGWARRWRANGWMRNKTEKALNADLWERLLGLCETCTVDFRWVKGHAGVPENERCDRLAGKAAREKHLPPDSGYKTETNVH